MNKIFLPLLILFTVGSVAQAKDSSEKKSDKQSNDQQADGQQQSALNSTPSDRDASGPPGGSYTNAKIGAPNGPPSSQSIGNSRYDRPDGPKGGGAPRPPSANSNNGGSVITPGVPVNGAVGGTNVGGGVPPNPNKPGALPAGKPSPGSPSAGQQPH